jgi:hypothetical protein
MNKTTDIAVQAPTTQWAVMNFTPEEIMGVIQENLGNDRLKASDLDRVTVPTGGGKQWAIPSLEGEEAANTISGVIVLWKQTRAYWKNAFTGENNPPDCFSEDGLTGVCGEESGVNLGGACESCPMAQFGSKAGRRGQACKQVRLLYLIRPDSMLPIVVSVPPTSLKPLQKYFLRLASRGIRPSAVVTALNLEKVKGNGVPDYSVIEPTMAEVLGEREKSVFRTLGDALRPMLEAATLEAVRTDPALDSMGTTAL